MADEIRKVCFPIGRLSALLDSDFELLCHKLCDRLFKERAELHACLGLFRDFTLIPFFAVELVEQL